MAKQCDWMVPRLLALFSMLLTILPARSKMERIRFESLRSEASERTPIDWLQGSINEYGPYQSRVPKVLVRTVLQKSFIGRGFGFLLIHRFCGQVWGPAKWTALGTHNLRSECRRSLTLSGSHTVFAKVILAVGYGRGKIRAISFASATEASREKLSAINQFQLFAISENPSHESLGAVLAIPILFATTLTNRTALDLHGFRPMAPVANLPLTALVDYRHALPSSSFAPSLFAGSPSPLDRSPGSSTTGPPIPCEIATTDLPRLRDPP